MRNKNIGLIILFLFVGIGGYIVYDKILSKEIQNEINTNDNKEDVDIIKKDILNADELRLLESFINRTDNNSFILMEYSNPDEILTKSNIEILKYSINASEFSKNADDDQSKVIWNGMDAQVSTKISSIDDLSNYLKEKTNYDFSFDNIKNGFMNNFNKELNLYYYLISDTIFEEHKIKTGYKNGNKYHILLDNNSELVLIYDNDNFYFYSCNINK